MSSYKILFSNLGYARGIGGKLIHHLRYAHRHLYCPPDVQKKSLQLLRDLIEQEDPDLCCFVEIDKGSFTSAGFNQLEALINEKYSFFDIENKYGARSRLRSFFITRGKSNAFLAKQNIPHEKLYFTHGMKRLIYKAKLEDLTLFFAHFALKETIRRRQILEVRELMSSVKGDVVFLGDFNILTGVAELLPLLGDDYVLLNREAETTFTFHKRALLLDLCICSKSVAPRMQLKVVPQPFSDHSALVIDIASDVS